MVSQSLRKKKPESRRAFLSVVFIASCVPIAESCIASTRGLFSYDCCRKRPDVTPRMILIVGTSSAASTRYRLTLVNACERSPAFRQPGKCTAEARAIVSVHGFNGSGAGMDGPGLGVRTLEPGRVRSVRLARSSTSEGVTARDEPDLEVESP